MSKIKLSEINTLLRKVSWVVPPRGWTTFPGNFKETCHFNRQNYGSTDGFINLTMKAEGSFKTTGSNYQPTTKNTSSLNKKTGLQVIKS